MDNNELLTASSPEIQELALASESQVDENHLSIAANKLACKMRCNAWYVVGNLVSWYKIELNFRFICEARVASKLEDILYMSVLSSLHFAK